MARPSQADLLAAQLSNAATKAPPSPTASTPWISEVQSFPKNMGAVAPAPQKRVLTARSAVSRGKEEDDSDEDDVGYGKRKPKESLVDLLSSEPPWAKEEALKEANRQPLSTGSVRKRNFLQKSLRSRNGSTPPHGSPESTQVDDHRFRNGTGTAKKSSAPPASLRYAQSSTSLRGNAFDAIEEERFLRSMEGPTRKLVAKDNSRIESTAELANFFRTSGPEGLSRETTRSRAASSVGSLDAATPPGGFKKALSKVGDFVKLDTKKSTDDLGAGRRGSVISLSSDLAYSNNGNGSPSSPISYRDRFASAYPDEGPLNLTRNGSLSRTGSVTALSPRKTARKPPPGADHELPPRSNDLDAPFMSPRVLAAILGPEAESEVEVVANKVIPPARSTSRGRADNSQVNGYSNGWKASEAMAGRSNKQSSFELTSNFATQPPTFKFTRRTATSDASLPPGREKVNGSSEFAKLSTRSADFNRHSLQASPPPSAPLPLLPPNYRPTPATALAVAPSNRPPTGNSTTDSLMDPPLSAKMDQAILPLDPIVEALRNLRRAMHLGAALPFDERILPVAEGSGTTPLQQSQLKALLPTLSTLQNQLSSAVTLLDTIISRANAGSEQETSAEQEEMAATVEMILGSYETPAKSVEEEDVQVEEKVAEVQNGEGEEGASETTKAKAQLEKSLETDEDDDGFPLLVKHLSR